MAHFMFSISSRIELNFIQRFFYQNIVSLIYEKLICEGNYE